MIKTTIVLTAALFGAVAASGQVSSAQLPDVNPNIDVQAEQTMIPLPQTEAVVAQFSYLELIHNADGFSLAVTDKTAVFLDLEFPGEIYIRIGF